MKALTIKQPWATLIMHHGKDVENREWATSIRGHVAITASSKLDWQDWLEAELMLTSMRAKGQSAASLPSCSLKPFGNGFVFAQRPDIPLGCVIGTIEIVDCVTSSSSPWLVGKHGFVLRDPRPLTKPIPIKGKLGFWDLPEEIEQAIAAELGDHL